MPHRCHCPPGPPAFQAITPQPYVFALSLHNTCHPLNLSLAPYSHCTVTTLPQSPCITESLAITQMPIIAHLQARFTDEGVSGGISATAIGLIVGLGLVPALILIWVAAWLMVCYPANRNCCCMRRKARADSTDGLESGGNSDLSRESLHEKAIDNMPQRPYNAQSRTESGTSQENRRLTKIEPKRPGTGILRIDTGLSMQSRGSIQGVQEPQRFV